MDVVLTHEATADLEAIADHIGPDNPRWALSSVRELRQACDGIGATPTAFPIMPVYANVGVRRRVHRAYLIFYRIDRVVTILHVLHGAMDYQASLFPKQ